VTNEAGYPQSARRSQTGMIKEYRLIFIYLFLNSDGVVLQFFETNRPSSTKLSRSLTALKSERIVSLRWIRAALPFLNKI